ncbi:hypothetical protein [Halobaculum limi]|nr:hypothetical protein [Halobaculum sp. YSMS11]
MVEKSNDQNMERGAHRTLEFASMRHNIAECVARLDVQTFGLGRQN